MNFKAPPRRICPARRFRGATASTSAALHRWRNDPDLNFPAAMIVHGRTFFALDELEAWEMSRAAPSSHRKAA